MYILCYLLATCSNAKYISIYLSVRIILLCWQLWIDNKLHAYIKSRKSPFPMAILQKTPETINEWHLILIWQCSSILSILLCLCPISSLRNTPLETQPWQGTTSALFQYKGSYLNDKTVVTPSHLYDGIALLVRRHIHIESSPTTFVLHNREVVPSSAFWAPLGTQNISNITDHIINS